MQTPAAVPVPEIGFFITNPYGERYLYAINRDTFTRVGSDTVFHAQFGDSFFLEDTFYIVCGSDSGLLIRYLLKHGVPPGSRYLFVEIDPVLSLLLKEPEFSSLPPSVTLTSFEDWHAAAESMSWTAYTYLNKVPLVMSLAAQHAHFDGYVPLWRELKSQVDHIIWNACVNYSLTTHWTKHLENLPDNQYPATCLKDIFKDKTAVVMGGGPSLNDLLPWIREHRNEIVLLSVSRISRLLREIGLRPDIIVSLDPFHGFEFAKDMLAFQDQAVFVNGYHNTPGLVSAWAGRRVFIGPRYPWSSPHEPDNLPQHGPTVTNACVGIAVAMGCANIILAGVDLCYSQEGYTHTKGTDEHASGPALMQGDQLVVTNSGLLAETKNEFLQAGRSIEAIAESAKDLGCTIINPAPNAARLEHVHHQPIETVRITTLDRPAFDILCDAVPAPNRLDRIHHYQAVQKAVSRVMQDLRDITSQAREALHCSTRLHGLDGSPPDPSRKARIDRIEKKLEGRYQYLTKFLKTFGLREFMATVRPDPNKDWSDEEILTYADRYYGAYTETADKLSSILRRVSEQLRMRLEEEKPHPNLDRLFEHWERQEDYFRPSAWLALHSEHAKTLPQSVLDRFDNLARRQQERAHKDRQRLKKIVGSFTTLHGLPGRAAYYFRHQNHEGLQRLARGLSLHPDQDEAKRLGQLVLGYLNELDNDLSAAIQAFERVSHGPGHEDAMMRLVILYLDREEYSQALEVLNKLTAISPFYQPYYADLLKIVGRAQDALDVYTEYLKASPDDLVTMMKMGMLYRDLGVAEAVQWVMQYILGKDPHNQAARHILTELESQATQPPA